MVDNLILILIIIIMVIMLIFILFLYKINKHANQQIKIKLAENENKIKEEMSTISSLIVNQLNMYNENSIDRYYKLNESVNSNLNQNFSKINESIIKVDEQQKYLSSLSKDIISLQDILTDKKTRGIFGEIELYNLLDNIFGEANYQKQYKLSNNTICDAIVYGPKSLGKIVIDSKFPLENYNRIMAAKTSNSEQQKAITELKRNIIKHLKDIKTKYVSNSEVADFAFMFVPAEAVYAYIYANLEEVVNLSYQLQVYIVSPTTLVGYLTAYKAMYLDYQKTEKIGELKNEYAKMAVEFKRFRERSNNVFKDFEKTNNEIRQLKVTSDKILNQFQKIDSVKINDVRDLNDEQSIKNQL